jgi:predicted Fe-Mo cluster-binding NifX family protein
MKIVISANGADLDAPASPVFGRCPTYIFVDTEAAGEDGSMAFEAVDNPAIAASGGAGIQAAQFVVERGVQAVVTGNVGPNAFNVLRSASVPIYLFGGGTVRQAVEAYRSGQLPTAGDASAPAHAGMGMGRGMGRGMGQGMGQGMGRRTAAPSNWNNPPTSPPAPAPVGSREEEVAELKGMAGQLRKQLAEVLERLERLEKGG